MLGVVSYRRGFFCVIRKNCKWRNCSDSSSFALIYKQSACQVEAKKEKREKFFEKGELVIAGDFKFLLRDNQLMLLKYTGTANKVVVPDEVGGVPVEYVHWTAFNKGRFATTTRIKNVWQILKSDEAGVYNSQTIKRASLWIETLQLPKYLKFVPDNLFSCCPSLRTIEIPENVTSIAPSAFAESKLRNVLISGPMIENLGFVKFGDDINVFCAKDCINAYKGVLM